MADEIAWDLDGAVQPWDIFSGSIQQHRATPDVLMASLVRAAPLWRTYQKQRRARMDRLSGGHDPTVVSPGALLADPRTRPLLVIKSYSQPDSAPGLFLLSRDDAVTNTIRYFQVASLVGRRAVQAACRISLRLICPEQPHSTASCPRLHTASRVAVFFRGSAVASESSQLAPLTAGVPDLPAYVAVQGSDLL
ncbi:hypothetical protein FA95DRAFT_1578319 [Auriscalpium vulgare]|uniref:Uncharacterized protein n=1 Tax=Auriscalpium vulgare TaxID=40419 RepID=A0ACB8R3D2_9AGAM|nr:hypothetical protein FA95DRAFT_1578319 [Auriscalpium vulgare]